MSVQAALSEGSKVRVAVIGAGIGGLTLAWRLAQRGYAVTVFERSNNYGGLAASMEYGSTRFDRYYHTILSSDLSMQQLIQETGVAGRLHFVPTKQGFYDGGKLYPFNSARDLLTFPPLSLVQRFRLGLQIATAQLENDTDRLDREPVEQWLLRVSGRGVFEKVWKPLLRAKFDTAMADVPATYIWSRLKRMLSTRKGVTSKEMMCYLEGGYFSLLEAIANGVVQAGGRIVLNATVEEIVINDGKVRGVRVDGLETPADVVISTLPSPLLADIAPGMPEGLRDSLREQEYLAVICPLLVMRERLTPYYVLNITDGQIPFTAVVETTNLISPEYTGGYHLVYLPKYVPPGSPYWSRDAASIQEEWMAHFRRMFPSFDQSLIVDFIFQRARYVEPLRPLGTSLPIPTIETEVQGLYLCNSAMVYPDLNNGESITRLAERVADVVNHQFPSRADVDVVAAAGPR